MGVLSPDLYQALGPRSEQSMVLVMAEKGRQRHFRLEEGHAQGIQGTWTRTEQFMLLKNHQKPQRRPPGSPKSRVPVQNSHIEFIPE